MLIRFYWCNSIGQKERKIIGQFALSSLWANGSGILFDSWDSGRSGKMACHPRLCLGQQTIYSRPP